MMRDPQASLHGKLTGKVRKGVVTIFVAISLAAIIGLVAISIDGGMIHLESRKMHAAGQ